MHCRVMVLGMILDERMGSHPSENSFALTLSNGRTQPFPLGDGYPRRGTKANKNPARFSPAKRAPRASSNNVIESRMG